MPIAPAENLFAKYFGKQVTEAEKQKLIPKEGDKIYNKDTLKCEMFKNGEWVVRQ